MGENIDLMDFHKIGKNGSPYDIIDNKIADYIISHENIIVIAGKPYIYKSGVYKKDEDGNILRYLIKSMIIDEVISINKINRVYGLILANHKLKVDIDEVNRHPAHWINFKNGFLDVLNMRLMKHDPKYLSLNQIPHDFNLNYCVRDDSVVLEFLLGVIPDPSDLEMLLEYVGYCMTVDTSLQKMLIIQGIGGTGKSTIVRMVTNAIGKENISNMSLQDLNERFNATNLFGKILNSCADIPSKAMEQVDVIKKITGEDRLKGEYKGGAVFFFNSYAKLMFSANEIPISLDDKTNAYYRRFLILRIDKRCHTIPNLEKRLAASIDDFIYLAVQALNRMYNRGTIKESENSKSNVMELYMASDTVTAFIADEMVPVTDFLIERGSFYKKYVTYCEENERQALTKNGFYKNLRNKGYSEIRKAKARYFKGLAYKEEEFHPVNEPAPFT